MLSLKFDSFLEEVRRRLERRKADLRLKRLEAKLKEVYMKINGITQNLENVVLVKLDESARKKRAKELERRIKDLKSERRELESAKKRTRMPLKNHLALVKFLAPLLVLFILYRVLKQDFQHGSMGILPFLFKVFTGSQPDDGVHYLLIIVEYLLVEAVIFSVLYELLKARLSSAPGWLLSLVSYASLSAFLVFLFSLAIGLSF